MRNLRIPIPVLLLAVVVATVGCTAKQEGAGDTRGIAVAQELVVPKKLALVIGNSRYSSSPLSNPVNDAELIYRTLRGLGFDASKEIVKPGSRSRDGEDGQRR